MIEVLPAYAEYRPSGIPWTAQVPLLEEGGIAGFLAREVLPYAPDAWFNPASVKVGYEISFNRHFYAPPVMRTLEEIGRDIADAEREAAGLLDGLLTRGAR